MQLYDITIAANSTRQLDAPGSYFYYYAGNAGGADSTITLSGLSSGLRIILKPGQAFRLPRGQKENAWIITNFANTATIIGSVIVGDGDITDNRVTGSVEVVDGGKSRSLSGAAYMAFMYSPVSVGLFAVAQLWNPASNTKNAIIKSVILASASAGSIRLHGYNTALTPTSVPVSKDLKNLQASNLDGRNGTLAAYPSNTLTVVSNGTQAVQIAFQEPLILRPGSGLIAMNNTVSQDVQFTAEYFEENI